MSGPTPEASAVARGFPPGPSGFGALRYLGWRRELIPFTERCRREYGGICGIRVLGSRFCLISDPLLIERVFVHHASRIKKWDAGQFEPILGQGLLTSNGALWKRQRSLIQPVFQPQRLSEYTAPIVEHTQAMLARWQPGQVIDAHEELLRLSLKIAGSALFGTDSSSQAGSAGRSIEERIARMQDLLMKQFTDALSGVPIPFSWPTPTNLRAKAAIRELDDVVLKLIAARRAARRATPGAPARDFLGAMLAAQDDAGQPMSDRQVRDECMTMLLASHETTALVLTWALWCLAGAPDVAGAVAQELQAALPKGAWTQAPARQDGEAGPSQVGDAGRLESAVEKLAELPGLRNALSESMRLYPPVWAIGRVNTEALDLGDFELPVGTQIFLVPFLAHRDAAVFADPLEFRPARWEDPKLRTIPRCSYMPFGSGPRKCVGMHFAVRESQLILAQILGRFGLERVPGDEPVLQASVTLRPAAGLRLRVVAHQ